MSDNVVVILSCGTDNPNRTTRALFFAMMAHKEGKNASLFLLDEGVYIAKEGLSANIRAATGDNADDHLAYLQANGVPILVCTPCAVSRGISEEELMEGSRMAVGAELIKLISDAAVISL